MSKAILVCVLLFSGMISGPMSGLTSAAADQPVVPHGVVAKAGETSQRDNAACLQAIDLVMRNYNDKDGEPLSVMAVALVRRCNGHPVRAICETSSQAMLREYGKTPFTCGINTADSVPLILPAEKPAP
jgi:hypothetical protein